MNANKKRASKYKWQFNSTTGQIQSSGAVEVFNENWCWYLKNPDRKAKQRIKIKECNENSLRQKFELINGRIHFAGSTGNQPDLCVGVIERSIVNNQNTKLGAPLVARACDVAQFGDCDGSLMNSESQQLKPAGKPNVCLFKRWNGYKPGLTVWFKPCDSNHTARLKK